MVNVRKNLGNFSANEKTVRQSVRNRWSRLDIIKFYQEQIEEDIKKLEKLDKRVAAEQTGGKRRKRRQRLGQRAGRNQTHRQKQKRKQTRRVYKQKPRGRKQKKSLQNRRLK